VTDPTGAVYWYDYDPDTGNLVSVTFPDETPADDADNPTRVYRYDDPNPSNPHALTGITDENGDPFAQFAYDAQNRAVSSAHGYYADVVQVAYDAKGNRVAATDPREYGEDPFAMPNTTVSAYDARDRLVESRNLVDPADGGDDVTTELAYDVLDRLVSVTDPEGQTTTYAHGALGHLERLVSPDSGETVHGYDAAGNRVQTTDARGVTATYAYDALGRLTGVEYPDPSLDRTFEYDQGAHGAGRLTGMVDESGTTELVHDAFGNVVSETRTVEGAAYVLGYGYDGLDRVQSIVYPSGRVVSYERDAVGRVSRITSTFEGVGEAVVEHVEHLPNGPVVRLDYGNGLPLERGYNLDYLLWTEVVGLVRDVSYAGDGAGNVTDIVDHLPGSEVGQHFAYDALGRLASETHPRRLPLRRLPARDRRALAHLPHPRRVGLLPSAARLCPGPRAQAPARAGGLGAAAAPRPRGQGGGLAALLGVLPLDLRPGVLERHPPALHLPGGLPPRH